MIIGIAVLLLSVGLSGCTTSDNNKDSADTNIPLTSYSIIGQWDMEEGGVMAFYEDGTVSFMNGTLQYDGTYGTKDNLLNITLEISGVKNTKVYQYEFRDSDTLEIEISGGSTIWWRK